MTKKQFYEGMNLVLRDRSGKTMRALMIFLGIAWVVLAFWSLDRGDGLLIPALELLAVALVILWTTVLLPLRRTRRAYKEMEARGTADAERIVRFYGDRLEVESAGKRTSFSYEDLSRILQGKTMLVFLAENGKGVLVKRDSFTEGNEEALVRRVKEIMEEKEDD